jgi:3-hydroxyisobutyrate dehydrogenase-like beta-hydroxyacid dehydrogenase
VTAMNKSLKTIGFIGVGGIGRPMAERLVACGFDLIVCDNREAALAPFRTLGVQTVTRASDCAGADMVILMVVDDAQALAATLGAGALLNGVDPAHPPLLSIMSTILPQTVEEIATASVRKYVRTIDAPVSGGAIAAAKGALSIMTGGAEEDLLAMRPCLDVLGSEIFHCGVLGAGQTIKILNNIMGIAAQFLMTEILAIARATEVDEALLMHVMEASSGRNFVTRDYDAQKEFFRYNCADPSTLAALIAACRKDLCLAKKLAENADVGAPLLAAMTSAHQDIPVEEIYTTWRAIAGAIGSQEKDSG